MKKKKNRNMSSDRVILNVGGRRFETTIQTLTTFPNTVLGKMFSSGNRALLRADADGSYFFDRDGEIFAQILNCYRTCKFPSSFSTSSSSPSSCVDERIKEELGYWGISTTNKTVPSAVLLKTLLDWIEEDKRERAGAETPDVELVVTDASASLFMSLFVKVLDKMTSFTVLYVKNDGIYTPPLSIGPRDDFYKENHHIKMQFHLPKAHFPLSKLCDYDLYIETSQIESHNGSFANLQDDEQVLCRISTSKSVVTFHALVIKEENLESKEDAFFMSQACMDYAKTYNLQKLRDETPLPTRRCDAISVVDTSKLQGSLSRQHAPCRDNHCFKFEISDKLLKITRGTCVYKYGSKKESFGCWSPVKTTSLLMNEEDSQSEFFAQMSSSFTEGGGVAVKEGEKEEKGGKKRKEAAEIFVPWTIYTQFSRIASIAPPTSKTVVAIDNKYHLLYLTVQIDDFGGWFELIIPENSAIP